MKQSILLSLTLLIGAIASGCSSGTPEERASRRLNAEGNEHYAADRYADAETSYTHSIEANASNSKAKYNLALAMQRQATTGESGKKLTEEASKLFSDIVENVPDTLLASAAAYNLGNNAYNYQQWDRAIEAYKQSLRLNPDDDMARENLRMAQLKKREQEQNKNQNQDNNQDNKDKQEQDKQQQNKQDNQQQQNSDNQDKQNEQQQPQQPQGAMSDENAEKILKAMENEEAATRRRVQEAEKRKAAAGARRVVKNPW